MEYEQLKLENQICFPVYALSRLITREYQPYLDKLNITYPQYLVLLVLWERDKQAVNEISKILVLNTNTVTPLLKRMEQQQLVVREKSREDERKVIVKLTPKAKKMKKEVSEIPLSLYQNLLKGDLKMDDLFAFKKGLDFIISSLKNKLQG